MHWSCLNSLQVLKKLMKARQLSKEMQKEKKYCIRRIFRGVFIFANFASRVLVANLTTRENIYLRSARMNATCVRNCSPPRSRI